LETDQGLEGIIDPPLETGQSTDHDNSCSETSPESAESDLAVDLLHGIEVRSATLEGVKLGDHSISRLGDEGTENTSNITRSESDSELGGLAVFFLGLGANVFVDGFNGSFESDELHDGVGDLSGPKRTQTLVETVSSFFNFDLVEGFTEGGGESSNLGSLNSDLNLCQLLYTIWLLTASHGHNKTSAITSAEAEEMAYPIVLYL